MLVGVIELRGGELVAQLHHARLRAQRRRRSPPTGPTSGALLDALQLTLDHREPVLFAAHRGRVRFELALQRRDHLQVGVGLLRQAAHVGFLRRPQPRLDVVQPRLARLQLHAR